MDDLDLPGVAIGAGGALLMAFGPGVFPGVGPLALVAGALLIAYGVVVNFARRLRHRARSPKGVIMQPLYIAILVTILSVAVTAGAWAWAYVDSKRSPITWTFGDGPHPVFDMRGGGLGMPLISGFQIAGTNQSDRPLSVDGFLRSNITNQELPLLFFVNGEYLKTNETNGVPPHSDFLIRVRFTADPAAYHSIEIPYDQFIAQFGDLTLMVSYDGNGSPFERHFSREELSSVIEAFQRSLVVPPKPQITPK